MPSLPKFIFRGSSLVINKNKRFEQNTPLQKFLIFLVAGFCLFGSTKSHANWSWGLGYHNPPGATLGLNFMRLWTDWALEAGIGWISVGDRGSDSSSNGSQLSVAGDLNLKYLFSGNFFRPYVQGGMGSSVGISTGNNGGAGASLGGGFGGAGFFLMGGQFYFYASYLFLNSNSFQFGIGFN